MHVYESPTEGARIPRDKKALVRSVYSPEMTIMTYLKLEANQYIGTGKVLNLVLDQLDRKRDLFYNIRVFASVPFHNDRCKD